MGNQLKYCPNCGQKTLLWEYEKKWQCTTCNFILYHNVAAAVAVVIKFEDEILFTIRNQNPGLGKLDLPGGFCDSNESAEKTCQREIFEELKLNIDKTNLNYLGSYPNIYPYRNVIYNTMDLFYECTLADKTSLKIDKCEIKEAKWIRKNEITLDEIAFESQKKFLVNYLKLSIQ